jgi:hypothetical protein
MSLLTSETEPYKVSNSEIGTYLQCRRKWWLTYQRRLRNKNISPVGPLQLGSRVHKALELHYRDNKPLLEAYQELTDQSRFDALVDGYDPNVLDDEAELGRIMLEGYIDWVATEGLDDDLEILGTEEILAYPMLNGEVTLMGKLDLRVLKKSQKMRLELDFKTAQSFNQFNDTGHMLNQLKVYQLLDWLTGDREQRIEGGVYRLLRKVKRTAKAMPPFYQEIVIRHNIYALRTFWMQLQGILRNMVDTRKALLAGGDPQVHAYPTPTRDCRWACPFFTICPMFDDGSDVDKAIADGFDVVDPYDYYAEITAKETA